MYLNAVHVYVITCEPVKFLKISREIAYLLVLSSVHKHRIRVYTLAYLQKHARLHLAKKYGYAKFRKRAQ